MEFGGKATLTHHIATDLKPFLMIYMNFLSGKPLPNVFLIDADAQCSLSFPYMISSRYENLAYGSTNPLPTIKDLIKKNHGFLPVVYFNVIRSNHSVKLG